MVVMAKKKDIPPTVEQWAAKLRALRVQRKLTQQEAADLAGLPVRTWISWENEQHVPRDFVRQSLIRLFPELG